MDNATKRPWKLENDKMSVISIDNLGVCDCYFEVPPDKYKPGQYEANARLIVKAVNCHDELVEVLKLVNIIITKYRLEGYTVSQIGLIKRITEVLTKAEAL